MSSFDAIGGWDWESHSEDELLEEEEEENQENEWHLLKSEDPWFNSGSGLKRGGIEWREGLERRRRGVLQWIP